MCITCWEPSWTSLFSSLCPTIAYMASINSMFPAWGLVPESVMCTLMCSQVFYTLVVQTTILLFFCLPMVTISVLYLLLGLRLQRERMLFQEEVKGRISAAARKVSHRSIQLRDREQEQVTKMLIALVIVFGTCWVPFHADRLMWSMVSHWTDGLRLAFQSVHLASGVFLYLGSAANPVLYNLMSTRFRESFRETLGLGTRCCHRHQPRHDSHSHLRLTTVSTLCDRNSRDVPLAENRDPGCEQETDPPE